MRKVVCPGCQREHLESELVCPYCGHVRRAQQATAPTVPRPRADSPPPKSEIGSIVLISLALLVLVGAGGFVLLRDVIKKQQSRQVGSLIATMVNQHLQGADGNPEAKDFTAEKSGEHQWNWRGRLVGDDHLAGEVYGSYNDQTGRVEYAFNYSLNAIDPNSASIAGDVVVADGQSEAHVTYTGH